MVNFQLNIWSFFDQFSVEFNTLLYELEAMFKQIALFLFSINSPVFDIPF